MDLLDANTTGAVSLVAMKPEDEQKLPLCNAVDSLQAIECVAYDLRVGSWFKGSDCALRRRKVVLVARVGMR